MCYRWKNWELVYIFQYKNILEKKISLPTLPSFFWHVTRTTLIFLFGLGIIPVWSEPSLSAWRKLRLLAIHLLHGKDSRDQTWLMHRLMWFCWTQSPNQWICHAAGHQLWDEGYLEMTEGYFCNFSMKHIKHVFYKMSHVIRKPDFCICKSKGADQLAVTAQLISTFVIATLYFLNQEFQASSHLLWLYSPVCVRPWRQVFSWRGSN